VLRTRLNAALRVALLGVIAVAWPISAQQPDRAGALGEVPLPGGLPAALLAIGDPTAADRGQFLLEFIRRVYSGPAADPTAKGAGAPLPSLLAYLERATTDGPERDAAGTGSRADTLPLGLPASVWHDVVLGGRSAPHGLLSAIVQSRSAALLYYGVLSLDDETRAWLTGQPELIAEVVSQHAGAFVVAAPAVRVSGGRMRVPGGAPAEASWKALAGVGVDQPAAFIRALLTRDDGRLAHFFAATGSLNERQIAFALQLDVPEAEDRLEAARRLQAAFARADVGWDIEHRPFWRPALDPALLASDLRLDASGAPVLPGTQEFWKLVFAATPPRDAALVSTIADGGPVEFGWLCQQVFGTDPAFSARRYRSVLFASRLGLSLMPANVRDSVEAIRAVSDYPALAAVLERGRVQDAAVLARAARRAAQLSSIDNLPRAARAIAQYQGALNVLARAASRRSISPERLAELVVSLSAVDPGDEGDYEGALLRWLEAHIPHKAGGAREADLLRLVAGTAPAEPRLVVWEGTRYRVDHAYGETVRISRLLGEDARPYVSSAAELVAMADSLEAQELPVGTVQRAAAHLAAVAQAVGWEPAADWTGDVAERYQAISRTLTAAAGAGDVGGARPLARPLRALSDDLLARGLLELTYAIALGQPERAWVTAGDVAKRHTFGIRPATRRPAWELPTISTGLRSGFGLTGALLGLDVALADLALVRLSSKPPPRRPMLADVDRKAFIQAVPLVEPAWLTDHDMQRVVSAMRKGRERAAALQSADDARAFAAELRMNPSRAGVLSWMVTHDRQRVAAFLSPGELLLSDLGEVPDDSTLHAWGAPALSRNGCLCLRLPRREPGEAVAGRWGTGIAVSTFPDLNLRLAELLTELQMPASLLGPVLASATLDFVNTVISRDEDDRRGLMEFVQALDAQRLEQYLALLTTDGPLVPVEESPDPGTVTQARP
jgi:hypothetical protein